MWSARLKLLKRDFMSTKTEMTRIVKKMMWGIIRRSGTDRGKPRKAGRIIVMTGTVNSIFDG